MNFTNMLSSIHKEDDYISTMLKKIKVEGENSSVHEYSILEGKQKLISKKVNFVTSVAQKMESNNVGVVLSDFSNLPIEERKKLLNYLQKGSFLNSQDVEFVNKNLFKEHNKVFTGYTKKFKVDLPENWNETSSGIVLLANKVIEHLKIGLNVMYKPEKQKELVEKFNNKKKIKKDKKLSFSPDSL